MLVSSSALLRCSSGTKWRCQSTCCVAIDNVSKHAGTVDRLTMLGPRPVIASLSLGATRTFRLRCLASQDTQSHTRKQDQEHGQAAIPSQRADHTPLVASQAQLTSQRDMNMQHVQQRQGNSSQGALDSGASAQPAQHEGTYANAQQAMAAAAQQVKQEVSSVDVVLPHNTLVIMWPPMQEAWKHEVLTYSV